MSRWLEVGTLTTQTRRSDMSTFYDDLAPLYHLIFADWDASIRWQGRALSDVIRSRWSPSDRVLDVSCGIGTQA